MVPHPVDDGFRIVDTAGKDEVTDDDALLKDSVVIELIRADLVIHVKDGFGSYLRIVFSAAVSFGKFRVEIFEVRQINLHLVFQSIDGRCRFITAAVIDDGDRQGFGQTL